LLLTSEEGANLNLTTHFEVFAQNCDDSDKFDKDEGNNSKTVKLMVDTFDASEPRQSRIFSLRDEEDRFVLEEDEEPIIIDEYDTGKLIGVVSACSPDFGKSNGSIARITTESITVYDK
jgi:hypothetical protein